MAWSGGLDVTTDVSGILRGTDLFGLAPDEELSALAKVSQLRKFGRGEVVFNRGDPGDTLIVVASGQVKAVIRSADAAELTLTVIKAGGAFGELSVADNGPRATHAETLEECQLLYIPRERVQDVCARVPSVAQALSRAIAASFRLLTEEAADLVFLDLPRRVAKVLLSQPEGADGLIRLQMGQDELAHQVGGTRQSVNAALRSFERRGWVEVRNGAVVVNRDPALGRFAGL